MKIKFGFMILFIGFIGCKKNSEISSENKSTIEGTWQLLTGTLIEKGDTTVTEYTKKTSFIKIINSTHFAFLSHDLAKGKDSSATYSSGGGKYEIKGNKYTEHLEYCTAREWEGNNFDFEVTIKNDTLVQQGVEIIEKEGINRMNIERYVRVKE
jgi:Lipocalin-like domain